MKYRTIVLLLSLHIMVSMVFWGGLCVWQRCRNALYPEQVAAASIHLTDGYAHIQVLDAACAIPMQELSENHPLWFAAHALTGDGFHFWCWMMDAISHIMEKNCS